MWTMRRITILCLLVIIFALMAGCCGEIKAGRGTVDVSPLYELNLNLNNVQKLSDIVDVSVFDAIDIPQDHVINGIFYSNGSVDVSMYLENDEQEAIKSFYSECTGWLYEDESDITYGGSGNNLYCISYVVETRSSVEALCRPDGEYESYVIFLKDRLVITILRHTGDVESPELDEAILKIAQAFEK